MAIKVRDPLYGDKKVIHTVIEKPGEWYGGTVICLAETEAQQLLIDLAARLSVELCRGEVPC